MMRFRAELTVTPTKEGGRSSGLFTGFRCYCRREDNHEVAGTLSISLEGESAFDAAGVYAGYPDSATSWLHPGETGLVDLHPVHEATWRGLAPGDRLEMWDGRVIATMTVLSIVGPEISTEP